jgi:hypothetical protein
MRKSSKKIIVENLTHYLNEHELKIVQLRKDEVLNTSYEEGSAVIVSNTLDKGYQLDLEELVSYSYSNLSSNDLFFDFLKYSKLETLIKQDDFLEFLKTTLSYSVIKNSKKNQHYHTMLYDSISEKNYLTFISRPSYIVDVIGDLPTSLFRENQELFNKVFNIALNTKAFKMIDFQTSTYKFMKENAINPQDYEHYFTELKLNDNTTPIKIIPLETVKIELDAVSFASFNTNKNYSFKEVFSLVEDILMMVCENKESFKLEVAQYYKTNPLIGIYLSAPKLEVAFYESFILDKVKEVLSIDSYSEAVTKTSFIEEEVEKYWLDYKMKNEETNQFKPKHKAKI